MTDATHTKESDDWREALDGCVRSLRKGDLSEWELHLVQRRVDDAMRRISSPIPLTPSDGKAVPTEAEWMAFLKANETMHCPVCGSNKRKPNGGAACGCNVTWVVDAPTPAPITPSDEMVEAGARALEPGWWHEAGDTCNNYPDQHLKYRAASLEKARACLQAALNLMGGKA